MANENSETERRTPSLTKMTDEELGRAVRETDVFRLAVACANFRVEIETIRNDDLYDRLVREAMENQSTQNVKSNATAHDLIGGFLDAVEEYGQLAAEPDQLAAEAAQEAAGDD